MAPIPINIDAIVSALRIGSLATFGAGGSLLGLYLSDWKAVVAYIPYYGGKFPAPEE